MCHAGRSYEEIASILLIDSVTIRRWENQLKTSGLAELLANNYTGGASKLSPEQEDELKAQEDFVADYGELKENKSQGDHIYFIDGVPPLHNSQPAFGWIEKGQIKTLKSNTGRQRMDTNGAYDIETKEVIIREDETINAQSTLKLFEQLSKKQSLGFIYLIADNAKYCKCRLISEYLSANPRIKMGVYLTPLSQIYSARKQEKSCPPPTQQSTTSKTRHTERERCTRARTKAHSYYILSPYIRFDNKQNRHRQTVCLPTNPAYPKHMFVDVSNPCDQRTYRLSDSSIGAH